MSGSIEDLSDFYFYLLVIWEGVLWIEKKPLKNDKGRYETIFSQFKSINPLFG